MKQLRGTMRTAAIVAIGAAIVLAAGPSCAQGKCERGKSFAGDMRCFVTQFPCNDLYFGIGRAPDYPKALKCFEANKLWPFAVMMYLNGEGVPRDLTKAGAILRSGQKSDPDSFPLGQAAALQKAIDACENAPTQSCKRVDYCRDLAQDNFDIKICDAIDQLSKEAAFAKTIAAMESKLNPADRALFRKVAAAFEAYQFAESNRAYLANADGTMADIASMDQAALVRKDFLKLIAGTVQSRRLAPADWNTYNQAGLDIRQAADASVSDYTQQWHDDMGDPNMKDGLAQAKKEIADYKKSVRVSQQKWMEFCTRSAQLASRLYGGRPKSFNPAMSMKTAMAKMRISELQYDPFGEN
ncbi:MAG: hypothetical protein ACREQI_08855 [Candidatus Binataceae bacterium]